MKLKITAVVVMTRDRRASLLAVLEDCGVEVRAASDRAEARRLLESQRAVHVALTDTTLPDANWCSVLEDVAHSDASAEVLVSAGFADAMLWCDALEHGAYDLLVEPYESQEVRRIVEAAAARSYMRSLPLRRESHSRIPVAHQVNAA